MPEIKIKVGAAVDQSMRTVFRPLVDAAKDARKQIAKEFEGIGISFKGAFTGGSAAARKELAAVNNASKELERERVRATKQAEAEMRREWAQSAAIARQEARDRARAEREASQDIIRGFKEEIRARKAAEAEKQRAITRFAENTSHRATRFFWPNMPIMSMARQAATGVVRGFGVDPSVEGAVRRGIGVETAAVNLSNRGHIEGDAGPNGRVVDPKELASEARKTGQALAVDPEAILGAGRAFVGLTGDLDLWRKIMPQVVKQTAALGGNQEDAAKAAGEFAAHIGTVPDKEKAILDLMAVAGGQGKIGGVDFSEFAKYAAKAAAPAAQFEGDKAKNIGQLTALAEIAKMHGGASSAAEAFTAISSLTTTLKKPARFKSIQALLGNKNGQFADDAHTQLRGPQDLIKDMIVAASRDKNGQSGKSSLDKLAAAIGDSRSLKAISGLQNTFNEAGGGKKGLDAMNEELKKFSGALLSKDEVDRATAERLKTREAKAEIFQQKLDQIVNSAADRLLPALDKLAPRALELADQLGHLTAWAASNPGEAIVTAIGASIARAGAESAFRAGLEAAIKGALGQATKESAGGVLGNLGLAGNLGAALSIATLSVTAFYAGKLFIDSLFSKNEEEQRKGALENANDGNALFTAERHMRESGAITPEDKAALERAYASLEGRTKDAATYKKTYKDGDVGAQGAMIDSLLGLGPALKNPTGAQFDSQHLAELKNEMTRVGTLISDLKNGTLNVRVTNQEMPSAPRVGTTTVEHY